MTQTIINHPKQRGYFFVRVQHFPPMIPKRKFSNKLCTLTYIIAPRNLCFSVGELSSKLK